MHNVIRRCIPAGRHCARLSVSCFSSSTEDTVLTVCESQRPIQGRLSGGKVQRLPDGIYSVNLCVVEPEQRVAWRGEEIVVDA